MKTSQIVVPSVVENAMATLSMNIRTARLTRGWSHSMLATEALVPLGIIAGLEADDRKAFDALDLSGLCRLAAALNVNVSSLLETQVVPQTVMQSLGLPDA